jgi:hypothetical protein
MPRQKGIHTSGWVKRSTPARTKAPTLLDIAWAAGFLEGEGSFERTGSSHRVRAGQVQREPLERLQAMFGGAIKPQVRRRSHQQAFMWNVGGANARGVAMTVYTLVSEFRRSQIRAMLHHA